MGKKTAIGLYFSYNENWIGGTYYILNIIKTINFLEDSKKPKLFILVDKKIDFEIVKNINYPYIECIVLNTNLPFWKRVCNRILRVSLKRELFVKKNNLKNIDILFPANTNPVFRSIKNKLFWIPDFQEKYLPQFFTEKEIKERFENQVVISNQKHLLFSSLSAKSDFDAYFPNSKINKYVYSFTSILEKNNNLIFEEVLTKYNLSNQNYFFSPNQFWKHKNQIIILKALKKLKESGQLDFKVYFSGKEHDYRNPNYFEDLVNYINENQLSENVKFLGFIDREDQICLMKNAMAIIQPSLFEGWSTVVEDTKALNQNCIVSNIAVHKEQLDEQAYYFDPNNEDSLIEQMILVKHKKIKTFNFDYDRKINENAIHFLNILNTIILND
jgi:glycosyltransferase involved in cell wall biosynthesis